MSLLFDTSKQLVSHHIVNILQEKELDKKSVVKDYLTTAADGKNYNVTYYALPMVLAVGFRVRSIRGTQFRIWANKNLTEFLQKGFVMDDERLKNPDAENVDKLITDHDLPLLSDKGEKSHKQMEKQIEQVYIEFDARRKHIEAIEADRQDEEELKMLEDIEKSIKSKR